MSSTISNTHYADIANRYARDVVDGRIPAGKKAILACQRHLADLEKTKDPTYPYDFNPILKDSKGKDYRPAERRCSFSEKMTHVKGKWSGQKIKLSPHQVFIQACIWGWVKRKNGKRRFRTALVLIPRKNGKSVDAATTGNYMLMADGENGAEVYSGATSEKQALEVFRPAWQMANGNPQLRKHFGVALSGNPKNPTSIYRLSDMSRFEPLIGKPGDGSSPHCAIIDEYHEHKTSDQFDTMDTGMGSREQPLLFVISTAGIDTSSPCYDMCLEAVRVLQGVIEKDSLFAIIYDIDEEDDWKDFEVWKKANPNYGVSVDEDYLYEKYQDAMNNASKQNISLCKHLNKWMNAGVAWMNMAKWAACSDTSLRLEDFKSKKCWMAFDLANKIDIAALVTMFRYKGGFAVFARYYLPQDTIELPQNAHYRKWLKEGWIIQTPGARTDFAYIEADFRAFAKEYNFQELAYDPHEATYLVQNLMQDYPDQCIEITQGPANMSEPMKELEALVYAEDFHFNGDPVLTWMAGNVVKKQGRNSGPTKFYYPTKERNELKIDGIVATIMALSRAMLVEDDDGYNERAERGEEVLRYL